MLVSGVVEGTVSTLDIHHLVTTPEGVETFAERHELGLFTNEEYLDAFAAVGLAAEHDPAGLLGRGLYVGVKA